MKRNMYWGSNDWLCHIQSRLLAALVRHQSLTHAGAQTILEMSAGAIRAAERNLYTRGLTSRFKCPGNLCMTAFALTDLGRAKALEVNDV